MIDVRAQRHVEREVVAEGREVRLVSRLVSLQVDVAGSHFGFTYRGPAGVEYAGKPTRIVDHILVLRLMVVSLALLGMSRRRLR